VALVLILGGSGGTKAGDRTVSGPKDAPFEMSYPVSWTALQKEKLAKLPDTPSPSYAARTRRDSW
jgi:hypothetical protein